MSPLWSDRKCSCTVLLHFCVTQLLLPTSIIAQTCSLDYFFSPLEDSENRAKNDLWIDASFSITFTVSMPQTLQADKSMYRADMKRLNKCSPLPTRWQTHYVCRWPALKLFESPNICHSVRGLSDSAPFFCPQNDSIQVHLHTQPGSPSNHCDCLFFFPFSLRILAALISPLQLCKLHFLFTLQMTTINGS